MYKFKRLRLEPKDGQRILVTSDIHGHLNHLESVLKKAEFGNDDLLIIVGDMLEKGPDSLGTLRYVMRLCEEGRAVALMGNVDYWRLVSFFYTLEHSENAANMLDYMSQIRAWKNTCFYDEMFASVGGIPETEDELNEALKKAVEHFKKELEFLRTLPTVIETEKYVFVHGGLPHSDNEFDLTPDEDKDAYPYLKLDNFWAQASAEGRRFDRYVVCGHWPVENYGGEVLCANPLTDDKTHIISIDGGCGLIREGQLNLLIFPSIDCDIKQIRTVSEDFLPTAIALEDQEKSESSFAVGWFDNDVRFISLENDFAIVEQVATGKTITVLADALWKKPETLASGDITKIRQSTDYRLAVTAGDVITVVKETSRGALAKKDGYIGWYYGGKTLISLD